MRSSTEGDSGKKINDNSQDNRFSKEDNSSDNSKKEKSNDDKSNDSQKNKDSQNNDENSYEKEKKLLKKQNKKKPYEKRIASSLSREKIVSELDEIVKERSENLKSLTKKILKKYEIVVAKGKTIDTKALLNRLIEKYGLKPEEIIEILKKEPQILELPVSIFSKRLSSLESIAKYLIEEKKFTYKKTASLLNRNERTIWTTYSRACKKTPEPVLVKPGITIPISVISERRLSVLESIVTYLHRELNLSLHQISLIVHRDQRTIWTIKHRAEKKAQKEQANE